MGDPIGTRFEHRQDIRHTEQLTNLLGKVNDLKTASGRSRRHIQADHGAQSHTVAVCDIGEIKNDVRAGLDSVMNRLPKDAAILDHQAAGATHDSRVLFRLHVDAELWGVSRRGLHRGKICQGSMRCKSSFRGSRGEHELRNGQDLQKRSIGPAVNSP